MNDKFLVVQCIESLLVGFLAGLQRKTWERVYYRGGVYCIKRVKVHVQGGESRDLFWLFRTCIRTERVRKLFSTSLKNSTNFHAVKYKYLAR